MRALSGLSGLSGVISPVGPTTLVLDQFTDADTTALSAHTIAPTNTPATAWLANMGVGIPTIVGNAVQMVGVAIYTGATVDSGVVNMTMTQTARRDGVNDFWAVFRQSDAVNNFFSQLEPTNFNIYTYIGGALTLRANAAYTWANGATVTITVSDDGALVTASLSTGEILTYSSNSLNTNTRQGFYGQQTTLDNFQVTTP